MRKVKRLSEVIEYFHIPETSSGVSSALDTPVVPSQLAAQDREFELQV
jgi:hypothetical protein